MRLVPNVISIVVSQVFWEIFLKKIDGTTDSDSYGALSLLVMIAKAKPSVTLANLEIIQTHGLTAEYHIRVLSAQLLLALSKKNQRYPPTHEMFTAITNSVLETYNNFDNFNSLASYTIDFIYGVSDMPETVAGKILAAMYKKIEGLIVKEAENEDDITLSSELLTRFIFVLGQIALQQLIYLDTCVYTELRRRNEVCVFFNSIQFKILNII